MAACLVATSAALVFVSPSRAESTITVMEFDIPAGKLADALDRFGEQSGLQVAYDQATVEGKRAVRVTGPMPTAEALNHLLANSGLSWKYVNSKTVILNAPATDTASTQPVPHPESPHAATASKKHGDVVVLNDITVVESLPPTATQPSNFALGFSKPLLETPRSVSSIRSDQMSSQGIATIEDILRVVPGTFTTTRYDLQGGINVRSVASDVYFRGMKRLTMQGHARTDLNAMDSIEIVEGPPSPIYGMGNMGGYTNLMPKSARALSGAYLTDLKGSGAVTIGSYQKTQFEAGVGAPYSIGGRQGGYYIFALLEDSGDFVEQVRVRQKLLQASSSLNNFVGPFRMETGMQYQNSVTSGSYMNRVTQNLINSGRYVQGMPLAQLDSNGDGRIGFLEMQQNSPVKGTITPGNQPLLQNYPWPTDATGKPYQVGRFPVIAGIPQTMMDYLNAHPEADPTGLLRAQGVGGPLPSSGQLPIGFVLDPRTTGYTKVDWHRNGAFERMQDADLWLCYFDLVDDTDPNFTMKNQIFLDNLGQTKDSYLPYGEFLDMHAIEDKFTMTRRLPAELLPAWLRVNAIGSLDYRLTRAAILSSGDDFDYRQDVMGANSGTLVPNTSFWNWVTNPSYDTGAPATINRKSAYDQFGVGGMLDVDVLQNTNLLLGGRWDGSTVDSVNYQRFNQSTGTLGNAGGTIPEDRANGHDSGTSWSISLSQRLPYGVRPYMTLAHSSNVLEDINNIVSVPIVRAPGGYIGGSKLKEAGIKASLFGGNLFVSSAVYQQTRADISPPSDPTGSAYRTSSLARGWETQFKWVPVSRFDISGYALFQSSKYLQNSQEVVELNARQLGFKDVVDPASGRVIYPAEAFLYGGRTQMNIPAALLAQFAKRTGDPEKQFGLNMSYSFTSGFGIHAGSNFLSSAFLDRTQTTVLPRSIVVNAGVSWDVERWHFKLNGYNLNNELYFRARSTDASDNMATVLPGRRIDFSAKVDF